MHRRPSYRVTPFLHGSFAAQLPVRRSYSLGGDLQAFKRKDQEIKEKQVSWFNKNTKKKDRTKSLGEKQHRLELSEAQVLHH